jgi:hypothetical protein
VLASGTIPHPGSTVSGQDEQRRVEHGNRKLQPILFCTDPAAPRATTRGHALLSGFLSPDPDLRRQTTRRRGKCMESVAESILARKRGRGRRRLAGET